MSEGDDREPIMGLQRRPPGGEFPAAVGLAMVLVLANVAAEVFLGLVSSASSLPAAALSYLLGAGFLVLAVGLSRLRRWAWGGSLGLTAAASVAGALLGASLQDLRYVPILPLAAALSLLRPAVRRALAAS
ncbi:MAG: hypothetical protein NVSMB17_11690 [Candidatus Dormibacteria bacterium]